MIENTTDSLNTCAHCDNNPKRCDCIKQDAFRTGDFVSNLERRINSALNNPAFNKPNSAQSKLDMIIEVRRLHEESIMSLLRLRTGTAREEADKLIHMSFYDALARLESQLKAELGET